MKEWPIALSLLEDKALQSLSDEDDWGRGLWHYERSLQELYRTSNGEEIMAAVRGKLQDYNVRLWSERGALGYSCDCAYGESGYFCKHCVAVALDLRGKSPEEIAALSLSPQEEKRRWLEGMTKEELVDLVLEQVEADEDFAASLDMKKDLDVAGEAGGIATVAGGAVDEAGADDLASLERRAAIVGAGVGIRVESREIMCPSECVEQADAISGRLLELAGDGEYVRVHGDELRRTVRNVQRALDCGVCGVFEDAEYNIEEALNKLG